MRLILAQKLGIEKMDYMTPYSFSRGAVFTRELYRHYSGA